MTTAASLPKTSSSAPPAPPSHLIGKILYAVLFCVVLPIALAAWAHAVSPLIAFPLFHSVAIGLLLLAGGVILMLAAFHALHHHGRGLPMNAFPPPTYVHNGPYRLTRHPIYVGFSLAALGASILTASPAGLWLITPLVMLGCGALVWGYERPDLLRRFGVVIDYHQPLLHIPRNSAATPTLSDRVSIYLLVLLPWLVLYAATGALPDPHDAFVGYFPFEHQLPVLQWTELLYGSAYLMVLLVPLLAKTQKDLRLFAGAGLTSMLIIFPLYLTIPLQAPSRAFTPSSILGDLLALERQYDAHGSNACPSYHVFWAMLAALVLARRSKAWQVLAWTWAILIAVSCITTGQHAIADVVAAAAIFPVILMMPRIYRAAVRITGRLANSFRAYRIGRWRILNHAWYSGLAAAVGILLIGTLTGPQHLPAIAVVALSTVIGAALWAQLIEGSPKLLRPFGYYGAIVGGILATLAAPLLHSSTLLLLAAFATAAPMIQAIGRLRCIVQGCCHGRPLPATVPNELGHRVTNPSSRICKMSPFGGIAIHPTPLYSIMGNVLISVCLLRLWALGAPLTVIGGLYLILSGLARFVEEAYRGEVQTRRFAGLPEYQWYAMISVVLGGILTALPIGSAAPAVEFNIATLPLAAGLGLFTAFAMSTDFPESRARFSRLTG